MDILSVRSIYSVNRYDRNGHTRIDRFIWNYVFKRHKLPSDEAVHHELNNHNYYKKLQGSLITKLIRIAKTRTHQRGHRLSLSQSLNMFYIYDVVEHFRCEMKANKVYPGLRAVSYTHLDVYKRQTKTIILYKTNAHSRQFPFFEISVSRTPL